MSRSLHNSGSTTLTIAQLLHESGKLELLANARSLSTVWESP